MAVQTQSITAKEFEQMTFDDAHVELVRGEIIKMTPAGFEHGKIAQRIGTRLLNYVEKNKLGEVCAAETGFILSRKPDTIRAPDAAFVAAARTTSVEGFFDGAPDLAVEVVSPGDSHEEVQQKRSTIWFKTILTSSPLLCLGSGRETWVNLCRTTTLLQRIRKRQVDVMGEPVFNYDEISDTLYVSFEPGEHATGVELNDHILLRISKNERKAIGLTFLDYSLLAQKTEVGPRSFPMTGLSELSDELREIVLEILQRPPVNNILTVSAYTPSFIETIPITLLQPMPTAVV